MPSFRRAARAIAFLFLALITTPALADPADIAAASRSVVRVVIIQNDGSNAQLITHGSGFAIAPDLVVTNAHVVDELRQDDSLIVGVVPAEGRSGYQARLVAYSPRNDLALLKIEGGMISPNCSAAFRLTNSSTFVTRWTGRSEGFSPLMILPA